MLTKNDIFRALVLTMGLLVPLASTQENTELRQVFVILGEPARAPLSLYPTDPFNSTYWARYGGLGQITPNGLLSSYQFGQYIKNFYSKFVIPAYNPNNVYARSIDYDSSLQGLSSFLAGMYPPANSDQLWSPMVSWFPMPVHSNEKKTDPLFMEPCPKYDSLIQESLNSVTNFQNEFEQRLFIQEIKIKSGLDSLNYYNLSKILDNWNAKVFNKLMLEDWARFQWANLTRANTDRLKIDFGSLEKAKLKAGGLLFDIYENIKKRIETNSSRQVFIYSVLNDHLSAMTELLELGNRLQSLPFGSAMIIELRVDSKGAYYVQVQFKSNQVNTATELVKTAIGKCNGKLICPILDVRLAIQDRILPDLNLACKLPTITTLIPNVTTLTTTRLTSLDATSKTALSIGCPEPPQNPTLTGLEIGLMISTIVLGLMLLGLGVAVFSVTRKNKTLKTTF